MAAVTNLLVRIDATTEQLRRELNNADASLKKFGTNTDNNLKRVDKNVSTLQTRFQSFNAQLGTLGVGVGLMQAGRFIIDQADAYVKLENQLKNVTTSQENMKSVMDSLFQSSQKYSIDINSQVDLFRKLTDALKLAGKSQEEILLLTDTFAASMKAGGASAADASRGILQLSQAFQGGKLMGEEMNTLRETMPKFVAAIIEELAKINGISLEEASKKLNKFKEDGQITNDVMVAAAMNMREKVVAEAETMADTTEQAMARFRNSMVMVGESLTPIIPHISKFFEDLSAGAIKTAEQIKAFVDTVQRAIATVKEFLGVDLGVMQREVTKFKEAASTAVTTVAPAPAGRPAVDTSVMMKEWTSFTKALGYQHGGFITGSGGPIDDKNVAFLSTGEFVVNARSAKKYRDLLEAINEGRIPELAKGSRSGGSVLDASIVGATGVKAYGAAMKITAKDSAEFSDVMKEVEDDLRDADAVFQNTRTATERYHEEMRRLNELKGSGLLNDETFGRAASQALERLRQQTEDLNSSFVDLDIMSDQLGFAIASTFETAILKGGKFKDLMKSLWQDIQQILVRQLVTAPLAAGLSAAIGGITGAMVGGGGAAATARFAGGGFVTGPAGVDRVPALLSSGEFVVTAEQARKHKRLLEAVNSNEIPGFAKGGFVGASPVGNVVPMVQPSPGRIDITLENKSSVPLKMQESSQSRPGPDGRTMIKVMVTDAVKEAMAGGEFDRTMGARYGATPQTIRR